MDILAGLLLGIVGTSIYWESKLKHRLTQAEWQCLKQVRGCEAAASALGIEPRSDEFIEARLEAERAFVEDWPPPRRRDVLDRVLQRSRAATKT
jgi:hypothetical protein